MGEEKIQRIREQFAELDVTHSGAISHKDFRRRLESAGTASCDVGEILEAVDANNDGEIAFSEFVAAALSLEPNFDDETLELAFRNFDADRDGCISAKDLEEVLGETFEGEKVCELVGPEGVTLVEFCSYMRKSSRPMPDALHGNLGKLRGTSQRSPDSKGFFGIRDAMAYHDRYVVVSGLQLRWWRQKRDSGDRPFQRAVDFTTNSCEVAIVPENPTRFILRSENPWVGENLDDVDRGRPFVFDAARSEHDRAAWLQAIQAHIDTARHEREAAPAGVKSGPLRRLKLENAGVLEDSARSPANGRSPGSRNGYPTKDPSGT